MTSGRAKRYAPMVIAPSLFLREALAMANSTAADPGSGRQRWGAIRQEAPEFARKVEDRFDKYKHKVLATLRKDGSPRVSGIEVEFKDGEMWLGMMPGSLKAMDLRRDPRLALHSGTEDPGDAPAPGTVFDAKVSGVAVEVGADGEPGASAPGQPHRFRIGSSEVVLISLGASGDHLVIETWRPGRGLTSVKRY